ncbi:flagellar basal-body MS-ring/collar protein FliF [Aquipuribacter sp. MA13-6]|uniref:flagellar basal-body MS-ring/collar protein FliF n=1 Tax=unclassified Aquipuribacter TaxID=2635084 RepID=UPI003EED57D0
MSPRQNVVSNDPRVKATQQARRAQSAWNDLPPAQKTIGVVVAVALLVGAVVFVQWQRAPQLGPLFTGLSSADGGAVVEQLQAAGVPYELADGGATVLVPSDRVYDLRLQMSAAGLPGDDTGGYSLLDEQGVTASQFQQEVAYQRAMEGELAKTIAAIDGVETAVVHLAIPEKDVFLEESDTPTASVLVQTATGTTLDKGQVQSIVNLVSSSIEGMTPESVTVVDAEGSMLSASGGPGAAAGGGEAADMTAEFESRVAGDLQTLLDTVVGPGNAVATVTAGLNFDESEATTERFLAPEEGVLPLSQTVETEAYTGAGNNEAGVLGPDNIAVPNAGGADSAYESESSTVNNAVGKVTERVVQAPGAVERLSVSVVVDRDAVARADMLALQDTVSAAVGLDAARGDVVSVTQMPFDVGDADAVAAELEAAAEAEAAAAQEQWIWNAVLAVLVLVVIIVTIVLGRRRKRTEPVDLGLYEPLEEPLPPAPLPPVPAPREALPAAPDPEAEEIAALQVQREEVIDLVDREPAEVAELLRSWLADRRSS